MNYMPDMAYFSLRRPGPRIVTTLRAHITGLIPYVRCEARGDELWFIGGDNFVTVEVLAPSTARRRVRVPRGLGISDEHLVELCSGPNHDLSYFPVFHDVALALLQFPGTRLLRGDEALGLEATQPHFARVMARLPELGAEEEGAINLRTAAAALMCRIHEAFPALAATPSVLPWLIAGITQDDGPAASTLAEKVIALRMPEALPAIEAAICDPAHAHHLRRLFDVYGRVAAGICADSSDPDPAPADEPWRRWFDRYALACRGRPGPLLTALGDREEVEDLLGRADLTYFIHQAEDRPEFAAELDAYVEGVMDDNQRFEDLLVAIAALCGQSASTWPRQPDGFGSVAIARWRAALPHVSRSLAPHVQALLAALDPGDELSDG